MAKTVVVGGRVPPKTKEQMNEIGLTVPEAVSIALKIKQDKDSDKKIELLSLLNENERLGMKIVNNNERIEMLKEDLNFTDYTNEQLTNKFIFSNIEKNVQQVLDRFYSTNESNWAHSKNNNGNIYDFFNNDKYKLFISKKAEDCGLTDDEFKFKVIQRLEEQSTLV